MFPDQGAGHPPSPGRSALPSLVVAATTPPIRALNPRSAWTASWSRSRGSAPASNWPTAPATNEAYARQIAAAGTSQPQARGTSQRLRLRRPRLTFDPCHSPISDSTAHFTKRSGSTYRPRSVSARKDRGVLALTGLRPRFSGLSTGYASVTLASRSGERINRIFWHCHYRVQRIAKSGRSWWGACR